MMQVFAAEPGLAGGAFAGPELIGIIVPEMKVTVVRPEHRRRGIGRRLVELAATMEARRGRSELFMGSVPDAPAGSDFLRATGFRPHSTVWDLELPATAAITAPVWPAGLVARPVDRTRDVAALPAAINAAFVDHPTPIVIEEAVFRASLDDPNILDDDAIVLEDRASGDIVAFCLIDVRRTDGRLASTRGELGMIGVREDRRGQGLGRQLVRAGATYLRGIGVPDVGLAVNGRNDGAIALYESEGFVRTRKRERWARPVPRSEAAR